MVAILILPDSVNLTALPIALIKTCLSFLGSALTKISFFSSAIFNSKPFSCIVNVCKLITSCNSGPILINSRPTESFPSSILAMSKISFIMPNKWCAAFSACSNHSKFSSSSGEQSSLTNLIPLIMTFKGFLNSWDVVLRNSVFSWLAF